MSDVNKALGAILHENGVTFRVWAPFGASVAVSGIFNDWGKTPMEREEDGVWVVDIPGAQAGQEYKYVITTSTGDELYKNDPRALEVAPSVNNSVIADTSFDWEDDQFKPKTLHQQVIYELHVGTFNRPDPAVQGTFRTVRDKLDYLADLGVTAIQLMPIGTMDKDRGWGYIVDYIYSVEALYGGRREFLEFVKDAHAHGMAVVLDVIYNHVGPTGNDLWQFDGWSENGKGGIYFYNDWRSRTPIGDTRLDYGRPEVRDYVLDNVRMWLKDCRVDGLRVDAVCYMRNVWIEDHDPSQDIPDAWTLLQEMNTAGKEANPHAIMIAEDLQNNDYITKPQSDGGAGFMAQWEGAFADVMHHVLRPVDDASRDLNELLWAIGHIYNGDSFQRIIYSDSHDSAGSGTGQRLNEDIEPGHADGLYARRRSLLATTIIMTTPGVPMIFEGQEFMQGGRFNDWQALDWHKAEKFKGITLAHKHLIALRKNQYNHTQGLTGQSYVLLHQNHDSKVIAYHRWDKGGVGDDVVVVLNLSNSVFDAYTIPFPCAGSWIVRFNSDWQGYSQDFTNLEMPAVQVEGNSGSVRLAPYSSIILSQDKTD